MSRGMISTLAPLGIALLGRRKGDVIEAQVPGGAKRLRVDGCSAANRGSSRFDPGASSGDAKAEVEHVRFTCSFRGAVTKTAVGLIGDR